MNFSTNKELYKEGTTHLSGVEEVILRNIEACKKLVDITRTSLGPNGMNKMVINHLEKLFVTHDAATIMQELDVIHPAAKLIVMAAQAQQREIGDGTNFVVVLAGELLIQAENLIRMGLHTSDIIEGYTKAGQKALEVLESLVVKTVDDVRNVDQVTEALKSVVSSKLYGYEQHITPLVSKACIQVCPKNPKNFSVDNVRVAKIEGSNVGDTSLMKGFVLVRDVSGSIRHVRDAKIAVFGCSVDSATPETKGTVLIQNAEDLMSYNKSEEVMMEQAIKSIADAGINVIVTGGTFGELALHFIERYKMMAIKVTSKFELRRLCKAVNATTLVRLGAPTAEEIGHCDYVGIDEIGGTKICVFRQETTSHIATIIVRGSTSNIMDDVERVIDDAVNIYKALIRDNRLLAGAGACEIELARKLTALAEETPGMEQYAIRRFAASLDVFPRVLAESSGLPATEVVSSLHSAHTAGKSTMGVDVDAITGSEALKDAVTAGIFDSYISKYWGIKLATNAAVTVLSVDQIIMAKPAGGPKPRDGGARDDD